MLCTTGAKKSSCFEIVVTSDCSWADGEMAYTIDDLPRATAHLRQVADLSKNEVQDFTRRRCNGTRENSLIFCFERAIDMAEGCALAADASLQHSLHTLARSMFEGLIWTRWVMLSEQNAIRFDEEVKNELTRQVKRILKKGYAQFVDESAQADFEEFAKNVPKRLRVEEVAKDAGFDELHAVSYGFYSMFAHGNPVRMKSTEEIDEGIIASTVAAIGFIQCVRLIVRNWIVRRDQTAMVDIDKILK